jgi:hypothetical protein
MREKPDPAKLCTGLGELLAAQAEIDFAYHFGSVADGMLYRNPCSFLS